jgi:hypothetical protein
MVGKVLFFILTRAVSTDDHASMFTPKIGNGYDDPGAVQSGRSRFDRSGPNLFLSPHNASVCPRGLASLQDKKYFHMKHKTKTASE